METGYYCKFCKFFAENKTLLKRHLATKKHATNIDGKVCCDFNTLRYKCTKCSTVCGCVSSMNRHKKTCVNKAVRTVENTDADAKFTDMFVESMFKIKDVEKGKEMMKYYMRKEMDNKNRELELTTKVKDRELELTAKINNIYENENKFHKSVVASAGQIVKKTVNMLTYAVENFKETPKLEMLDSNTARKLLEYEANDGKKGNVQIAEYIAKMSEAKILPKHLGNTLTAHYKKDVFNQQSIWTTDTNRIKFIVKTADGWIKDSNNELIGKIMVTPLLKEVSKVMDEYCADKLKHLDKMTKKEESRFAEVSEQRITIKEEILNDRLQKGIIKMIAPCFVLQKRAIKEN